MFTQTKVYHPFVSPFDPCRPLVSKTYATPPHLYLGFQPPNLPQFTPVEAIKHGVLWPALYSPYEGRTDSYKERDRS
ncbi:spore coat associated protein CotJA [Collibacillus ludicampi]|uniref:spore coat associated protein CotJA n=1 Tax=Collibacillus ludicampi TaxID=2771369 RepID=UPI0024949E5D|nr:spore coat associated protein CotJA [Collibacillus ludicampi]